MFPRSTGDPTLPISFSSGVTCKLTRSLVILAGTGAQFFMHGTFFVSQCAFTKPSRFGIFTAASVLASMTADDGTTSLRVRT